MIAELIQLIMVEPMTTIFGDNIFVGRVPYESSLPALVIFVSGNDPTVSKDSDRVLDRTSVTFNIYAEDYMTIVEANDALRDMFNCYNILDAKTTSIKQVIYDDEADYYEDNNNVMVKSVSYQVVN